MLDGYTSTGKTITFTNGKTLPVYQKPTKKGQVRFYYWGMGRFFPIAKSRIDQ